MTPEADPFAFQSAFFARHPLASQVMGLFDALPGVVFYAKDTGSRFVRVNGAFLANHGLRDEREVLGRTDRALSPPALAAAYMEEDRRVMAGRRAILNQVWLVYQSPGLPQWYVSS